MLTFLCLAFVPGATNDTRSARLLDGFALERASEVEGSFLALCFDAEGRAIVGVEDGPIRRLSDRDRDGVLEQDEVFCADLRACQGLARRGDELFAVARNAERAGVWRIAANGRVSLVVPLVSPNEHGAHGIAFGPDGALYLACGNEGSIESAQEPGAFFQNGLDGDLLPTIEDPLGVGATTRWPYGFIARIDPASGAWSYHSVGYRNHYDLAFDDEGELFTVDSDMEYDVGLPWYRPVRAIHARFGVDYGFRRGSSVWPESHEDCGESMASLGRGSPTGVAFGFDAQMPDPWRDALFVGDWSQGRIVALHLTARGSTYGATVETFAEGDALASVTDLAIGPDGALWFLRGGRGLKGPIQRVMWSGKKLPSRPAAGEPELVANANAAPGRASGVIAAFVPDSLARSFDPRVVRRACEELARRGALEPRDVAALSRLLVCSECASDVMSEAGAVTSEGDRALRAAARAALERGRSESADRLARSRLIGARGAAAAAWLLVVAESPSGLDDTVDVDRALRMGIDAGSPGRTALRALSIAAQRANVTRATLRRAFDAHVGAQLAHGRTDREYARALDVLDAHAGGAVALDRFLTRAEHAQDRIESIGAAWQAASTNGWDASAQRRFLLWYERTRAWTGGASFRGYLEAMRDRATADTGALDEVLGSDFEKHELSAPALAYVLRRLEIVDPALVLPHLRIHRRQHADDAAATIVFELGRCYDALSEAASKRATLAEIAGAKHARIREWLRTRVEAKDAESGLALVALARAAASEDSLLLAHGLDSAEFGAPKACADALIALEPSDDVAIWSLVLETARKQGNPRGWQSLRVLAAWLASRAPAPTPEAFDAALVAIERKARERFPALPAATPAPRRPAWSGERTYAFLARSASRPGSAASGAEVFSRATCASCHTVAGHAFAAEISKGASGPDLGGVTKRLHDDNLLEAIVLPSRAVSDQFRTLVVETKDERRFEGRVRRDDARGIELVEPDGRVVALDAGDVASKRVASISAMPEGLLAPLTLEDVRDLFAFLHADGAMEGSAEPWSPLFDARDASAWSGDASVFRFDDGVLVGRGAKLERSSYLVSRDRWSDFELEFDVSITRGGNSGLQYRSRIVEGAPDPIGYQADVGQIYWGSLYATDGRGLVHEADARTWRSCVDVEGWNHYFVRVEGDRHVIEVNGVLLTDARDAAFADGVLAWQVHQGLDMEVRVANARVRRLR